MLQRKSAPNKPKRYCSIQSCMNFRGSSTGEYTFFRPPADKCTHDKWIEAIGEHQQIRHISLICELHFQPQDVIGSDYNKRRKLKTGSIPTIFMPNSNAVKVEPISNHPVQMVEQKIVKRKYIEQQPNENDVMTCQNCTDQTFEVQELNQKLQLQIRLAEYWKAVALKYEPTRADPKWSFDHIEKVTTELLEAPPLPPPPSDKVFKPYQCGTCNECFEEPRQLEWHVQEHSSKKRQPIESIQKCIVCSKYLEKIELDRHLCTNQKRIGCEHCGKAFSSTSCLLKHLKSAHKKNMRYKCDRCQQSFGMNLLLTIHTECHDEEDKKIQNRFKCTACSIVFAHSANLEKHKKFHCTFIKSANLQLCELCGSNFQNVDELRRHMQQHNEFECHVCSKFFKTNFSLKKHQERHHGSSTTAVGDETQMG